MSKADRASLVAISKLLGISPSASRAQRRYTRDGGARPLPHKKPRGYSFHPTLDGIGVLAPDSSFDESTPRINPAALANGIAVATKLINRDKQGSALAALKDLWWENWATPGTMSNLAPLMATCYHALHRPTFAAVVENAVNRFDSKRR